jgi:hypothetical protein
VEAVPCGERENESRGEKSGLRVFQFCPRL